MERVKSKLTKIVSNNEKNTFNKLTSVFHASALLLIMNFVKVAVDP